MSADRDNLAVVAKTLRFLAVDGVEKAGSGHPGMPMGAADYAAVLWSDFLRFNPEDPSWPGRDRFVLSAGHGSMLLYGLLHLFQYDLPISELENFRQWDSRTPGHPEFGLTPGVECTTGPLGQGFANGVGMALSSKLLEARYDSDLFCHRVFGIVSDGDLMEGVTAEAASLAGHLQLGNLVYIYDDNKISIGGSTEVCFTESVAKRFESYGWHVLSIDGHDFSAIQEALTAGCKETGRPTLICAATIIGSGSPNKEGTAGSHGAPLGKDEVAVTKDNLSWPREPAFYVPAEVTKFCKACVEVNKSRYQEWGALLANWKDSEPEAAARYEAQASRDLGADLRQDLKGALIEAGKNKIATRMLSGAALQVMARHLPGLIGGSADLEPSNMSLIKDSSDIGPGAFEGRNLRFGVREHAMGSIANGLACTQSWIPYTATFLVFADYMRPPIRLAALSHLQTLFIFTHDSIYVGEDGPTHQPIEQIQSLRLIPNHYVFRPADGLETAMSYIAALEKKASPSSLLFTRQGLEPLERGSSFDADLILKGGYIVSGHEIDDLVLIGTGSETQLAVEAAKSLARDGTRCRVVSMPCQELFLEQDQAYRDSVIPSGARCVSIEAGSTRGWEIIVGAGGLTIGIDRFGASAPGGVVAEKLGMSVDAVRARISAWL